MKGSTRRKLYGGDNLLSQSVAIAHVLRYGLPPLSSSLLFGGMTVMSQGNEHVYLDCDLYLDLNRLILMKGTFPIPLSITQFLILRCLSEHLERPVSAEEIIRYAWSSKVQRSELHKQINRIRDKLEPTPNKPRYLLTVRGYGYLLHTRMNDMK